jgi:hypothetical protein
MKYMKWDVDFSNGIEGTTPEPTAKNNGFECEGLFSIGAFTIVGKVSENLNANDYANWNMQELSLAEVLELGQNLSGGISQDENGIIILTMHNDQMRLDA